MLPTQKKHTGGTIAGGSFAPFWAGGEDNANSDGVARLSSDGHSTDVCRRGTLTRRALGGVDATAVLRPNPVAGISGTSLSRW